MRVRVFVLSACLSLSYRAMSCEVTSRYVMISVMVNFMVNAIIVSAMVNVMVTGTSHHVMSCRVGPPKIEYRFFTGGMVDVDVRCEM